MFFEHNLLLTSFSYWHGSSYFTWLSGVTYVCQFDCSPRQRFWVARRQTHHQMAACLLPDFRSFWLTDGGWSGGPKDSSSLLTPEHDSRKASLLLRLQRFCLPVFPEVWVGTLQWKCQRVAQQFPEMPRSVVWKPLKEGWIAPNQQSKLTIHW